MPNLRLHPAVRLCAWVVLLIAVQSLEGRWLAATCLCAPLLTWFVGPHIIRRGWRLLWRARWILVSLFVVFAWGVAGDPLWSGPASPTQAGVILAGTHLGRLLLVLLTLAAFLESMPLPELLAATHQLIGPLRRARLDPDRGVVRLLLVLRYVENLPRARDWRSLLDAPATIESECVEVELHRLGWFDALIALGLALLLGYLALSWWRP
ncbi:MAG: CbiQ family ECF transporter T component [Propionivibrio sp.]